MTRSELIRLLAEKQPSLSHKERELIVKNILDQMSAVLSKGGRIEIRRFGSFSVRYREPRLARNPRTGDCVEKKGKFTPYFRPSKELRERVNLSAKEHSLSGNREDRDEK